MPQHRRYTRTEKVAAVAEATRTSLTAASESLRIPITTLSYWYDHPDFAEVRTKTADDLAVGSIIMAAIAQGELVRRIRSGKISDQALVSAYGVGIDKAQLLSGGATGRTETRDITGTLTDADVREVIRTAEDILAGSAGGATPSAENPPTG